MAKFGTLKDNFDDNSLSAQWTTVTSDASVTEQNQRLELYTGNSGSANAYISSVSTYDLTSSGIQAEIIQVAESPPFDTDFFIYLPGGGLSLVWYKTGTSLIAQHIISGVRVDVTTLTYNNTTHRWWRIRESAGTIYWETSSDGKAWTQRATYAHSLTITALKAALNSYATSGSVKTGNTYMDTFNIQQASITLTGTSGGTFTPKVTYKPSITLTGTSAIDVYGTLVTDQAATTKTYLYKVYNDSDTFLGTWDDVVSDFTYSQEINSAGSSIQVELARTSDTRFIDYEDLFTTQTPEAITTFDGNTLVLRSESINNIGPGSDVDVNYRVEVWVFYGEQQSLETTSGELILTDNDEEITLNLGAVNGLIKFNGYITKYVSRYGSTDSVLVSIASFGRELDHHVIKSGSNTTVTYNSTAPNAILTDALDKFAAQGGTVSYTAASISATGTTVSYTFRLNTFLEVIKKCLELAPYDWYWYVDLGEDLVYFKARPSAVSHYFILGEHIEELNLEYNIEEITNLVYFTGGETAGVPLFKTYTDATSIANYRQGLKRISDHRVTLSASADLIGESEIDRNDAPRYKSSVTILSETYPIEEITLGQLVGFRNFGNYVDETELQVVGIDYEPNKVRLQLDTLLPRVNKRIEDLTRNLIEADNKNLPSAPS